MSHEPRSKENCVQKYDNDDNMELFERQVPNNQNDYLKNMMTYGFNAQGEKRDTLKIWIRKYMRMR